MALKAGVIAADENKMPAWIVELSLSEAELNELTERAAAAELRFRPYLRRALGLRVIQPDNFSENATLRADGATLRNLRSQEPILEVSVEKAAWLASLPYAEYLQTPEWKARSRAKLVEADEECQLCGEIGHNVSPRLQVHHVRYDRRGNEWWGDLIVLCRYCHSRHHDQAHLQFDARANALLPADSERGEA